MPVPAEEEPTATQQPAPAPEPRGDMAQRAPQTRFEVVEHANPAQIRRALITQWVKVSRIALAAINADTHDQQALLDLDGRVTEIRALLAQSRRQASNWAQAEQLAAHLEAANEGGMLPAEGTAAFDRLSAQHAGTMRRRSVHVIDDPEQTGHIPRIRVDDQLPPPAPSPTGRVAAGDVVHAQDPLARMAFPACVSDAEQRKAMLARIEAGELEFLPTKRALNCTSIACGAAAAVSGDAAAGDETQESEPQVEVTVVSAPQRQYAPVTDPQSPVHQVGDDVEPAVPAEEKPAAQTLPQRPKPKPADPKENKENSDGEDTEAAE